MGLALAQRGFGSMMPPPGVELDWSHPLARGLIANFLGARMWLTYLKNYAYPITPGGTFNNTTLLEYDDSLHFPAGASNGCITAVSANFDLPGHTGCLAIRGALLATGQPNYTGLVCKYLDISNAAAYALDLGAVGANNTIRGYIWSGAALMAVTGGANIWKAGEIHTWILNWDGSYVNVYQDGIAVNTAAAQTADAEAVVGAQGLVIGAQRQWGVGGLTNFANLRCYGVWLYQRHLSLGEIRQLCDEPYALYSQPARRNWSLPGAAMTARSFAVMVG